MRTIAQRKRKEGAWLHRPDPHHVGRDDSLSESQIFECKAAAQPWIKRRKPELNEPGTIEKVHWKGTRIKRMTQRYPKQHEKRWWRA